MAAPRAEQQGGPGGAQVETGMDAGKYGELRISFVAKKHFGDDVDGHSDVDGYGDALRSDGAKCGQAFIGVAGNVGVFGAWSCV